MVIGYAVGLTVATPRYSLKVGPETAARAHVYLAEVFAHEEKFKEAADEIRAYLKVKPDAADAAKLKEMEADWRARGKRE